MTKRKYGFILTQKGAPLLARNLNDDYSFRVPVNISTDHDTYMEDLSRVTHIYYHSSEGWIPYMGNVESNWDGLVEDDANTLWQMAQSLGDKAVSQMFYTAECIWKAAPQEFTITDEDIL